MQQPLVAALHAIPNKAIQHQPNRVKRPAMRHRLHSLHQRRARNAGQAIAVRQILAQQQVNGTGDGPRLRMLPRPSLPRINVVAQLIAAQHTF